MNLEDFTTVNYKVRVGENEMGMKVYQVLNKETNVIEYEDNILSRTLESLEHLEFRLNEVLTELSGGQREFDFTSDGLH